MTRELVTEVEARWSEPRGFSILPPTPEPPLLPIAPPPPAAAEDPRAVELLSWLPPLAARIRAREVAWLVERGIDPRDPMDARNKLLSAAEEVIGLRLRISDRAETLRATAAGASGAPLQEVLARHLRATVRDPRTLREDLRALNRDLQSRRRSSSARTESWRRPACDSTSRCSCSRASSGSGRITSSVSWETAGSSSSSPTAP